MNTLPPIEARRPDRYYGVTARGMVRVGSTVYRDGDVIPCIGVRYAGTQGRRIEVPAEEVARVGIDPARDHHDPKPKARLRVNPTTHTAAFEPDPRAPHIVWVHDLEHGTGGAERSNAELIRVGRDIGWRITHVHRGTAEQCPVDADVYLVATTHTMTDRELAAVERRVYARGAPVVVLEHDYAFCHMRGASPCVAGRACDVSCMSPRWAARRAGLTRLLEISSLAVWVSDRQRDFYADALGKVWRRDVVLPPAVDVGAMYPEPVVSRDPRLAVCTAGVMDERKGRSAVAAWAKAHPDWRVEVYVRGGAAADARHGDSWPGNVTVFDVVEPDELRRVYSRAAVCLFLPSIPEPAGRTPVEAALCGCQPVTNEHWSAACFGLPLDDPEALRSRIRAGRFDFWRAVEGVLA